MPIPKSISIAGIDVAVLIDNALITREGAVGQAVYAKQQIILDDSVEADNVGQSFWHEATHWILFIMGRHDLRKDENFVDVFSHLLYQVVKSGGYVLPE